MDARAGTADVLRRSMRGPVLEPGDPTYEAVRPVWNAMIAKRPALIARCVGVSDVVAALRFARERDLEISVRGGGHNVAGFALTERGLMIDLSLMNTARVDPRGRRAWVGGGALLGALDREAQHFGLATTAGVVSHTGAAGLTLGGGLGWLGRKLGLTCDNVASYELVTADGQFIKADAESEPDLFWGLRGGGGNFGVVTSFEYTLHAVGPQVLAGKVAYDLDDGAAVLRGYRDLTRDAPDDLTCLAHVVQAPPLAVIPEQYHGRTVILLWYVYAGPLEHGMQLTRPYHTLAQPAFEFAGPASYAAVQAENDQVQRHGFRQYWKAGYLDDLTDDALDAFLRSATKAAHASPACISVLWPLGGAIARVGEDESAYGHRQAAFNYQFTDTWTDPDDDALHRDNCRQFYDAMLPFANAGVYLNNLTADESEGRLVEVYGAKKLERLKSIKRRYDPDNVFHLNVNIWP